jgi:cell division transport system permease protein
VFGDLETNPLPASLAVRLKPGFRDTRHVQAVAERLKGFRFADDIRFGRDWVEKLDRLRNIGLVVSLLVGGAFAAASVIIISTTIRISVLHRAREIAIMRLVGATDGFIRLPFLLEGAFKGAAGGALAVALCGAAYATVTQVYKLAFFTTNQAGLVVVFGLTLGLVASGLSVGRQIRKL